MADYGHDLAFGTFITPQAQHPDDVVALAQLTEQAGLDLATFQDHPYQPAFLDTWTLLSWVAAQTQTLRLAPNVLNLPLRPPAVVARAAASLDLLSGGRVELGLGAGSFWDAIEAMGGRRLTPGQSVDALSEAIDVIRGIWNVAERGGVRVEGEHYRVRGAKRGPEPAHEIEIWLGAYKPRMLRLTGRKADGWLPSLSYLPQEDIPAANRTIDEAASAAGRNPREIRRLLNLPAGTFGPAGRGFLQGPPEEWVDQLLPFVLQHGFSTFFLAGDDPGAIDTFGRVVAPALRDAVARERQRAGTPTGPVRRARVLAQRREGIDYDALPESLAGTAVEPGDNGYHRVRSTYIRAGSPGLVLRPDGVDEVAAALAFAREQEVPLALRSGGHGISGRSTNDGGVVIDLAGLDGIDVLDPESGRIRLGPGARWGHVAQALAPHGLAMSSGDYGDVGVGGLATTGGLGFLARRHGLTIDHVAAAELVLADGTVVRADAGQNPELLWAVRGAGANFGIVTALELDAYRVQDVVFSVMLFDGGDTAALIERWGEVVERAPRELTSFLYGFSQRGSSPVVRVVSIYADDDTQAAVDALTPLLDVGPVLDQQAQLAPYAAILPAHDNRHDGGQDPLVSNGFAVTLTPDISRRLADGLDTRVAPWLAIRAVGGAVNDLDPSATAYAHRHQAFNVSSVGGHESDFHGYWDGLRPHLDGLYLSFETDRRAQRLQDAFPGETLNRLRELKERYDPEGVFDQNFPITPSPAHAVPSR
jgi:FAD/FMN-containing dehydrogenase